MLTGPSANLRGVAEHLIDRVIAIEHERPQAFPVTARHFAVTAQLQQVHRFAVEVADAVLGQDRQVLALEPFTRKQRAIVIEQKAFGAARHGPAARLFGVQYCSGPA